MRLPWRASREGYLNFTADSALRRNNCRESRPRPERAQSRTQLPRLSSAQTTRARAPAANAMKTLTQHLFERQTGIGSPRFEAGHSEMVRSIHRLRPMHQMHHQQYTEALAAGVPAQQSKELADRSYIARMRFNKPGNLVGTSYWSHDSIELWSWQQHTHNHKLPVPTLMGSSIVRFDWLYSNPEAHMVVLGKHGDVKLLDLRQLVCYNLVTKQRCASMAYGLHPELPFSILYGARDGLVRDFDVRRGPLPEDALVRATNRDGSPFQLYSLKINPADSNQFAVAGCAEDVRLYDRRSARCPLHVMYMTTYPGLRSTGLERRDTSGEYSYVTDERRSRRWNLQEMAFNYNGTQLALSCGYDSIYVFDTHMRYPIGSFTANCLEANDEGLNCSITGSVVYGLEYFGLKSDFMIAMARGHEHIYDANLREFPESYKRTSLYIWDSFSHQLVRRIPMPERNWNFAAHPHLPVIATALDQKGIQLWNAL
ncbi:DDB1- and CUL4-associated factor 8-like [Phymastichus coffea]|uniref:DDB1- and CUL4-associated factor 8-like n=1 Tax=Phymastichus coffea TaxID=108790 RepID=UPI00273B4D62|nr:DDB1- and CUL4-associated factor 8-like [Phymastichus coffea]